MLPSNMICPETEYILYWQVPKFALNLIMVSFCNIGLGYISSEVLESNFSNSTEVLMTVVKRINVVYFSIGIMINILAAN